MPAGSLVYPVGPEGADHGDQKRPDQISNSPPENAVKDHKHADGPHDAAEYRGEEEDQKGYGSSGDVHGEGWFGPDVIGGSSLLHREEDLGAPLGGVGFCAGIGEVDFPGGAGGLEALGANPFEERRPGPG